MLVNDGRNGQLVRGTDFEKEKDSSITVRVGKKWKSHPGIPTRDQTRIALILSLEFGVILLLKFADWKANAYRGFS
jgi:hypothetical protein